MNRMFLSFVLLASSVGVCFATNYQAPVTHSEWVFKGNRVVCYLNHTVPQFGQASFEQHSGEPLKFVLKATSYVPPIKTAMLESMPPVWMHDASPIKLASLKGQADQVVVGHNVAERMLHELSAGRFPQFSYPSSGNQKVHVSVSAINFQQAMSSFEVCRSGLLPYSRNDVHDQFSLFDKRSSSITHDNRRFLERAVKYVKEAGEQERIDLIAGTTEISVKDGRRMHPRRIESIRNFLIEKGMPEDQVVVLNDPEELDTPSGSVRLKVAGPEPFLHIFFRSGSTYLNDRDHAKLDYLLHYMSVTEPKGKLLLEGHTDSEGNRHANLAVSKTRVEKIKKYLISKGVSAERISTKAYGESRPTTTNRLPTGRQLNRRVDISILS